ncbi:hypothetical protein D3C86_1673410 [compost metagenome]
MVSEPSALETVTILAAGAFCNSGKNAWVMESVANTFVSQTAFNSLIGMLVARCAPKTSSIVRPGFPACEIAALLTNNVKYPHSRSISSTAALTES